MLVPASAPGCVGVPLRTTFSPPAPVSVNSGAESRMEA